MTLCRAGVFAPLRRESGGRCRLRWGCRRPPKGRPPTRRPGERGCARRPPPRASGTGALHGWQRRSAQAITQGRVASTTASPSSRVTSQWASPSTTSSFCEDGTKARSRYSATAGPTWPVSESMELRPTKMTSKGPQSRRAAPRERAVAKVSLPANSGSQRWTAEVAPHANASSSTLEADSGPSVNTVHESPDSGARATPAVTARRQKAFISRGTPSRRSRPSSPRDISSGTGTCFTRTATRTVSTRPGPRGARGFRRALSRGAGHLAPRPIRERPRPCVRQPLHPAPGAPYSILCTVAGEQPTTGRLPARTRPARWRGSSRNGRYQKFARHHAFRSGWPRTMP